MKISKSFTVSIRTRTPRDSSQVNLNHLFYVLILQILVYFTESLLESLFYFARKYPTDKMVWYPRMVKTNSRFCYKLFFVLFHYFPAFIVDVVLKLKGSKMRLVKIYNKTYSHLDSYNYFFSKEWKFSVSNIKKLHSMMSDQDHSDFTCVGTEEEWDSMLLKCCIGARQHLLQDPVETLPNARKKYAIMRALYYVLCAVFYAMLIYLFRNMFAQNI